METRSRKRAETSSSSSSSSLSPELVTCSSKRARTSTSSAAVATPLPSAPSTVRTRVSRSSVSLSKAAMDPSSADLRRQRGRSDKGKEQDSGESSHLATRDVEREAERVFGLAFDSSSAGDDEDGSGDGATAFSAGSALRGLLRKLGAGLDELLPSSSATAAGASSSSSQLGGRLKKILSGLRAEGEEGRQVEALTQLCEMLSIGTEDSLITFSVDTFVPVLVGLLNYESNPDIMLLAARALTHLCDVLPSSCSAVVHYGAVPCFCARLLTIEYMDLAEQSLQALKKISQEHPTACLRAGALMAVLSYLDFFSTGVQRVALATAANMCQKLTSDAAEYVMDAVPLLTNLLNYHDSKVLEYASVCLTRIAEAFSASPDKLDVLCNHGLVAQAATLISLSNSGGQTPLSPSTYTGAIRLLSACASGSQLAAKTLLILGISSTLKDILSCSGLAAVPSVSATVTRPSDQIYETVNLADELLPPLPIGTIALPAFHNIHVKGSLSKRTASSTQDEASAVQNNISGRETLLHDQPELLQQFAVDLLPVLTQVYSSSLNGPIRHKCLSVIGKIMYYSPADLIQTLVGATNISSFLAGILASRDPQVLVPALQIAEILMEKLPNTFSVLFMREGVVHAVDALICPDSIAVLSNLPALEKDNESSLSSRSHRNRRRSSATNAESCMLDELKSSAGCVGSPPISSGNSNSTSSCTLRAEVSEHAKAFKHKYFPADSVANEVRVTDELLKLQSICSKLNIIVESAKVKSKGKSKGSPLGLFDISSSMEEQLNSVIAEMLAELSKGDGVSTFEFIGSGVVAALLNYLSCGTFGKEEVSKSSLPMLRQQVLKRYKSFISVALPVDNEVTGSPMTLLVRRLQYALSSVERFPVVLSNSGKASAGGTRLSSGLSALSHPFKLRLCRAKGEKSLRDYSSTIVLIDPLASLAAVEEFLWPRVMQTETAEKLSDASECKLYSGDATTGVGASSTSTPPTRRLSTRSRSLVSKKDAPEGSFSTSNGKDKSIAKSAFDERKGPQTRNALYKRASLDKDSGMKAALHKDMELKGVHDGDNSEDELDASALDIDDTLMIDEDEISDEEDDHEVLQDGAMPLCIPERVHDVKFGDTTVDSGSPLNDSHTQNSSDFNTRFDSGSGADAVELYHAGAFDSKGAMSYAAAAMSGLVSVSGRGIKGSRDRCGPLGCGVNDHDNKLSFTVGGKQLSKHLTIYQAIQQQLVLDEENEERFNGLGMSSDGGRFSSNIFTINYQKADNQTGKASHGGSTLTNSSISISSSHSGEGSSQKVSLLDGILQGDLPCDLKKSNPTYDILSLLRVLEGLNQLAPWLRMQAISDDFAEGKFYMLTGLYKTGGRIPSEEFVNNKLTPKLTRQIQDVLALCSGSLPLWCYQMTKACPFLFPFETRRQYFYSTAFGLPRALNRLQQQQGADNHNLYTERQVRIGRLQRQKVRVSRNRILDSAEKVMDMFASQKAVLEVEYFGEVGTGLGPTLEFYTVLSHELQKVGLGLWRSTADSKNGMHNGSLNVITDEGSGKEEIHADSTNLNVRNNNFIHTPLGLFPQPWPPNVDASDGTQFARVLKYFRLVGQVMAKALQDGRLLDLPFSTAFCKLVLGQELELHDILSFDPELGKTLQELQVIAIRKKFLQHTASDNQQTVASLQFHGAPIEDLCLDFTLPGYPEYHLKEGGESLIVNIDNIDDYICRVVDATVKTGISRQMEAVRYGFNQVFDISTLQIFSPHELDYLLCGRRELWEPDTLVDHMKFDHGYTAKSPVIVNLLEVMAEFTPELQHAFCQFVTGAPRLPPGGLAELNPKLTIVRKHPSGSISASNGAAAAESADDDLPSVMTCANYLKLPPYSTKEIMYKKLLYAIKEGQGSFDLS